MIHDAYRPWHVTKMFWDATPPEMKDFVMPMAKAFARLQSLTAELGPKMMANPDEAGAASTDYLRCVALVAIGFMWAQIAKKSNELTPEPYVRPVRVAKKKVKVKPKKKVNEEEEGC